jgi:hypothetical protein
MFQPLRPLVAAAEVPVFGRAAPLRPHGPRFTLVVDLAEDLFTPRWWRGLTTLSAMVGGLGLLAPPLEPLPTGPFQPKGRDQAIQQEALGIAPLSAGSDTGLQMSEGPRARLIASAPERTMRELTLVLSPGDRLADLLRRNGASAGEAGLTASLARAGLAPSKVVDVGSSVFITAPGLTLS